MKSKKDKGKKKNYRQRQRSSLPTGWREEEVQKVFKYPVEVKCLDEG